MGRLGALERCWPAGAPQAGQPEPSQAKQRPRSPRCCEGGQGAREARGLCMLISLQSDSIPSEMDFLIHLLAALKMQSEFRRNGGRHQKTFGV